MGSFTESSSRRGCLYFNFGTAYALRLLVSVHSLRKHYAGPVTVFLGQDDSSAALGRDLESLGVEVRTLGALSKSWDRHRLFLDSPYETTLAFDSDTLVMAPIDELWEPLEREGLLVTRFHAPPHGVDGTAENPQWGDRMMLLRGMRGLVDEAVYAAAERRLLDERIDVNVGVMGVSRPLGDRFLEAWAEVMERGRSRQVPLLDEM